MTPKEKPSKNGRSHTRPCPEQKDQKKRVACLCTGQYPLPGRQPEEARVRKTPSTAREGGRKEITPMYSLCDACAPRGEHCAGNCTAPPKRILATTEKASGAGKTADGGPRTAGGKAVSARTATSHGVFARDIVLLALGEDLEGYRQIEAEFTAQTAPRNLLERHYVEKIAAAFWRLRRLHRRQAQLSEDQTLTEDERLNKLDKVLLHESALHRQIDTAVKMLNKDVPQLAQSRARDQTLLTTMQTEIDCRENRENELEVTFEAREWLKQMTAHPPLDDCRLDAAPPIDTDESFAVENCHSEPSSIQLFPNREGSPLAAGVRSEGAGGKSESAGVRASSVRPRQQKAPRQPARG